MQYQLLQALDTVVQQYFMPSGKGLKMIRNMFSIWLFMLVFVSTGSAMAQSNELRGVVQQAEEYQTRNDFFNATDRWFTALKLAEKEYGPNDIRTAKMVYKLALAYRKVGTVKDKRLEIEGYFKRALAIQKKILGSENETVAETQFELAVYYSFLPWGRCLDAEEFYKISLDVFEKALGPNHPKVVEKNKRYQKYKCQGEPRLELKIRALAIDEKKLGANHPDLAEDYKEIAGLYFSSGRLAGKDIGAAMFAKSESYYLRSLAIHENTFRPDVTIILSLLENLVTVLEFQKKYDEALTIRQNSLSVLINKFGTNHPKVAGAYFSLAQIFKKQKKYGEAEQYYKPAIRIYNKLSETSSNSKSNLALSLYSLAEIYHGQDRYAKAYPLYRKLMDITNDGKYTSGIRIDDAVLKFSQILIKHESYEEVKTLISQRVEKNAKLPLLFFNTLGQLYLAQQRYNDAEAQFNRQLTVFENRQQADPTLRADAIFKQYLAKTLVNLGNLNQVQGRTNKAASFFNQAEAIKKRK